MTVHVKRGSTGSVNKRIITRKDTIEFLDIMSKINISDERKNNFIFGHDIACFFEQWKKEYETFIPLD